MTRTLYVVGLRLNPLLSEPDAFVLWYDLGSRNAVMTAEGRILLLPDERSARAWGLEAVGSGGTVSPGPAGVCDVVALLEACLRPDEPTSDLLATIDLLDDIRETADQLNAAIVEPARAMAAREVHDQLRDALFSGCGHRDAFERAGGPGAVVDATLDMVGRIALASGLLGAARGLHVGARWSANHDVYDRPGIALF